MPKSADHRLPTDMPASCEPSESPLCPVGEKQCTVIDEVNELRQAVNALAEQARSDPLTGLFNYRHLRQLLEQEMERTCRTQQATVLVMIDLDHFKQVNDQWGHEVGNRALVSTAECLRQVTRRLDIPCRYGGEEFAVVLPSTDLLTGVRVAERIRQSIADQPVLVDGVDISLTASIGVDLYLPHHDDTPEQFIARVDQCLYQAKQAGRNQVCHGVARSPSSAAVSKEERDLLVGIFGNLAGNQE